MSQPQKQLKIILIGDSCHDKTHYGHVNRLSPEAPIPILDFSHTTETEGMATNVLNNFIALGVNEDDMYFYTEFYENKNRYIDEKTKQQLLRVDTPIPKITHFHPKNYGLWDSLNKYNYMVIADYDKGTVSYDMIHKLRKKFHGTIFLDTKKPDLQQFRGCILKINNNEWNSRTSDPEDAEVIVTHGGDKVCWMNKNGNMQIFYPPKVEAFDACGCGDTFLAALAYYYGRTQDLETGICFAMDAAAETIKHIGVYAPTWKEISDGKKTPSRQIRDS